MPKYNSNSKYNDDCSVSGITKNYLQIKKDAAIEKPISTGSFIGDQIIYKIPIIGQHIKAYNTGSATGANTAHVINAYNESCKEKIKK